MIRNFLERTKWLLFLLVVQRETTRQVCRALTAVTKASETKEVSRWALLFT